MKQSYNFQIKTKTSRFQSHVQCENENPLFLRSCAKPQTSTSSPPHWKEAKKNWLFRNLAKGGAWRAVPGARARRWPGRSCWMRASAAAGV